MAQVTSTPQPAPRASFDDVPTVVGHRGRIGMDAALVALDAVILGAAAARSADARSVTFALLTIAVVACLGGYRHRLSLHSSREFPRVLVGAATAAGLVAATAPEDPGVSSVLRALPFVIVAMTAVRLVLAIVLRRRRTRGRAVLPTLVVGAGPVGQRIVKHLKEHPEYGLVPMGYVDDGAIAPFGLPVHGGVADLAEVIERLGISQVIVAFGVTREVDLVTALRACEEHDVDVWAVPRFFELGISAGTSDDEIWGLPLKRLRRPTLRSTQWRIKRFFDGVLAGLTLLLLSPVLLVITVAVKSTSPGPVFFRQRRVGQRGVPFDVLKFRTMEVNDDEATTWDVTDDERVTFVGRVLRPTSLDELPQLLNVLRGDMSLVGPRPERPYFVHTFRQQFPRYDDRHRVPVGITGLAQVNGLRGDTSIEDRAIFDNYYIENWSLWADIVILLRTIGAVIRPPLSIRVSKAGDAPQWTDSLASLPAVVDAGPDHAAQSIPETR